MSEFKHTPGPWDWRTEICDRGPVGKGNNIRVSLSAPRNGDPVWKTPVLTPNWNTSEGEVWQVWVSCNDANARLIAAAPELLEALQKMVKMASTGMADFNPHDEFVMSSARAAIAKARGES